MIDISKAKWEFSKEVEYAINWFNENGYDGTLDKQYMSKTKFTVIKDGVDDKFELPSYITDIKGYMNAYEYTHSLKRDIKKLEAELKEKENA